MFGSARIGLSALTALCRRLATALTAGIEVRTVWKNEIRRAPVAGRAAMTRISDKVAAGSGVAEAVAAEGDYFPQLFRAMVYVGETTGSLAEVCKRLADYYDHRCSMRRTFLASIVWPMIQLASAIVIVGLLIWAMGEVVPRRANEKPLDPLGFGLLGWKGLAIYLTIVGAVALAAAIATRAVVRGALWTRTIQRAVLRIPVVGSALETLHLARIAWTLQMTLNVEMDLRKSLPLAMDCSGNDHYARHGSQIAADIEQGSEIHEALARTKAFRREFLDELAVAEQSGRLVESMQRLSRQYDERAELAMKTLSVVAGYLVWAMVATILVALIFRLAFFYIGGIRQMLDMTK